MGDNRKDTKASALVESSSDRLLGSTIIRAVMSCWSLSSETTDGTGMVSR